MHPIWRACKRAGLRPISWHVLRHTFASHLVMRGVPLKAVQELMGHATIEMTMRYAHLSPDVRRSAVQLLDHGNAGGVRIQGAGVAVDKWWRRRESNPRPKALPFPATTCLSRDLSSSGGSSTGPLPAEPSPNEYRPPPSERHGGPADFSDGTCRRHRLGSGVPRA